MGGDLRPRPGRRIRRRRPGGTGRARRLHRDRQDRRAYADPHHDGGGVRARVADLLREPRPGAGSVTRSGPRFRPCDHRSVARRGGTLRECLRTRDFAPPLHPLETGHPMYDSVGFPIAFMAGVLSFLSPCVLPLVPSYLSFVTGMSLEDLQEGFDRRRVLTHAALFVSGFTLIFVLLGPGRPGWGASSSTTATGSPASAGVIIILFGLHLMGVFQLTPAAEGEARAPRQQAGRLRRHRRGGGSLSARGGHRASAPSSARS